MARTLEHRRLAIVQALRAVMAEPLPTPVVERTVEPIAAPVVDLAAATYVAPETPETLESLAAPVGSETVLFETSRPEPPARPSLREALAAEIVWDDVEDDSESEPAVDPIDGRPLEEYDADWVSPSVPPLESTGSFSRTASMALFGHA